MAAEKLAAVVRFDAGLLRKPDWLVTDMHNDPKRIGRVVYPKPEHRFPKARIGMTYRDSKPDFPTPDEAPPHAPNIVIVLLDDVGYGWPSTCGGLVRMPAAERLARHGLNYCQFHTTGLCAPTRAALLTGRNHHSVSTGIVQEMATGFPGYCGLLPRSCATIAQILSFNGYATGWWGWTKLGTSTCVANSCRAQLSESRAVAPRSSAPRGVAWAITGVRKGHNDFADMASKKMVRQRE